VTRRDLSRFLSAVLLGVTGIFAGTAAGLGGSRSMACGLFLVLFLGPWLGGRIYLLLRRREDPS
jgi:hypothetical protein